MTDAEREMLIYALDAPNMYAMACIIADTLCGGTGADTLHIRATTEWERLMKSSEDLRKKFDRLKRIEDAANTIFVAYETADGGKSWKTALANLKSALEADNDKR